MKSGVFSRHGPWMDSARSKEGLDPVRRTCTQTSICQGRLSRCCTKERWEACVLAASRRVTPMWLRNQVCRLDISLRGAGPVQRSPSFQHGVDGARAFASRIRTIDSSPMANNTQVHRKEERSQSLASNEFMRSNHSSKRTACSGISQPDCS